MEFCSLGSGSAGNALLVRTGNACLMLDCGFGPREFERRISTSPSPASASSFFWDGSYFT